MYPPRSRKRTRGSITPSKNRVEIASVDLVLRLDSNTPSLRIDALASALASEREGKCRPVARSAMSPR
jgi:hypothetical protein